MRHILLSLALVATGTGVALAGSGKSGKLEQAVADPAREEVNRARDVYRHPVETLRFFGVKPGQKVVELWPGGGWYTEILGPYLNKRGKLYSAGLWPDGLNGTRALQERDPARFGKIELAAFPAREGEPRVADGSVDVVLTFRNVHNWRMGYKRDGQDYSAEAFRQIFAMLRPGGVLGVVDHRLPEAADAEREKTSGYVKTSTVKKLAADAGFRLAAESEVNANPKDSADWPKGVWTLPPVLALGDQDRARYLAIGESDRMTLKFVKPRR
jgi:predicted methyltransferase